jgi:hypothetical protein
MMWVVRAALGIWFLMTVYKIFNSDGHLPGYKSISATVRYDEATEKALPHDK